ncbi:hypothetical protein PLESTB_000959400 [Pleodorina starrii]|uniref:Uncharacterized protein n=1 Tax=Pleodorina starrii TaxID=330485 RepID=A0A9W6C3H6_9CHLO|nr:hypothetical protein PLESTM_001138700 [Pleodorina starrii]GLC77841.1 hypothetical protein PLESTB_000959400 [Pleodorina starrii]GLC77846.1 hypothetical protein PLESTF_001063700 [Pleodorina starrii]
MSTTGSRERELQSQLKQREAELKQANEELEERGKLLYKTKVAIEQLQQQLTTSRQEEQAVREEASRVCGEQAAQLRHAEEQVQSLQEQLQLAAKQNKELQSKAVSYEVELEQHRTATQIEGSSAAQRLREKDRQISSLEDEIEGVKGQSAELEKMLRDTRSKLATLELDREETERLVRDLTAKNKQLAQDKQELQHQLDLAKSLADAAKRETVRAIQSVELSDKEKSAIEIDWSRKMDRMAAENEIKLREVERKLRDLDSTWQAKEDAIERSWVNRMQEVEQHWEKRLRDGMTACERKFAEEAMEWERRIRDTDTAWQAKVVELEQLWRGRLSDDQRLHDADRAHWESQLLAQRAELEGSWSVRLEETRRSLEAALEEATSRAAAEREALERTLDLERAAAERAAANARMAAESAAAEQRAALERGASKRLKEMEVAATRLVEEARSKWAAERATAEGAWANRMAEVEAKYRKKLEDLKRKAAARELEIDNQWKERLDDLTAKSLAERELVAASWNSKLAAAQEEAAARYRALQDELDTKVATISNRLTEMAGKEGRRELQRGELTRQLEELQSLHEAETRRRAELERALRDAAAMFKAELYEKQAELDTAYRDARSLRQHLAAHNILVPSPRAARSSKHGADDESSPVVPSVDRDGAVMSPPAGGYYTSGSGASPRAGSVGMGVGSLGVASDLEAEVSALRAARAEYQRSISATAGQGREPRSYSANGSPAVNRNPNSKAAKYISRMLVEDDASVADTQLRREQPLSTDPAFDAWKNRLSSRLTSALKKLEPSVR